MRHRWSAPDRTEHATHRTCTRCGLVKITRHEPGEYPWTEWRLGDFSLFPSSGSPPCTLAGTAPTVVVAGDHVGG